MRYPGRAHDLVVLSGVEPHLRFAHLRRLRSSPSPAGSAAAWWSRSAPRAEAVPHTRPPLVVGSSTTDGLVRALGLSRPTYQGITGLVGVLQQRLDAARHPGGVAARRRAALPGQRTPPEVVGRAAAAPRARARRADRPRTLRRRHRTLALAARRGGRRRPPGRAVPHDARGRVRPSRRGIAAHRRRPRGRLRAVPPRAGRRGRRGGGGTPDDAR